MFFFHQTIIRTVRISRRRKKNSKTKSHDTQKRNEITTNGTIFSGISGAGGVFRTINFFLVILYILQLTCVFRSSAGPAPHSTVPVFLVVIRERLAGSWGAGSLPSLCTNACMV